MNGRNVLKAPIAVALVAAAVTVTQQAAARPQGETPATPATGTTPPAPSTGTGTAAPQPPSTGDAAPTGNTKPDQAAEDPKKKPVPQGQAGPDGAPPAAGPAREAAEPAGVSIGIGGDQPRKDEVKVDTKKTDDEEANRNRFAGSIFFWDHSMSTQTARLEPNAQQSYNPSYEWWFSLQPRYSFTKRLQYRLRADLFKEMTNSNDTTYYRENSLGDVWNTLRYEMPISERLKNTKVSFSGTIKLPLSKTSQAQGVYFKPSAGVGLSQKIPINGESAKWFPGAGAGLSVSYEKPIVQSTTPTGAGFEQVRQDTDGRSFTSDQITGGMLPAHTVLASVRGDLSITDKWNASLSLIMIQNWLYAPTGDVTVRTATGDVAVPRDGNASRFTQSSWLILSTDYDVLEEMSVGLGYYNLAGIIASNGERRGIVGSENIWWSPSARIFATITANLDKIYERAAGIKKEEKKETATGRLPGPTSL